MAWCVVHSLYNPLSMIKKIQKYNLHYMHNIIIIDADGHTNLAW